MLTAAQQAAQRNRGTVFVEQAEVLERQSWPGEQYLLRLRAAKCAAKAQPGSFVHLRCDESLPMRRPLSIMRTGDDWIEILFKLVGDGMQQLAARQAGDFVSVLGPVGTPFQFSGQRPNTLLIGGGVGIPPMVFIADALRQDAQYKPLAILGSELPFPFELHRSALPAPWLESDICSAMPLLERWGVPSRLASLAGFDGCFNGYVTELADKWLASQDAAALSQTEVFACGPTPMLQAVATLASRYELPCQVSLEEFMACAVGGCAGCTVRIDNGDGPAMKRVCVDGPVFDASSVVWA